MWQRNKINVLSTEKQFELTSRDFIQIRSRRRPLSRARVESMISGDDTVGEYFGPVYEPGTSKVM